MDPVSHIIFGRTLTALDGGRLGRGAATAAALGALAPDVDAVLMPIGWDLYLRLHEIGTHSILGTLPGAALVALVVHRFASGARFRSVAAAAWIGSISHVILDICSGAQIRVGWPLLEGRTTLPLFAMADPYAIAAFAIAALILLVRRRDTRAAALALSVVLLFGAVKGVLLAQALSSARNAAGGSGRIVEARWASLTDWHVFDRTPHSVRQWRISAAAEEELLLEWPVSRSDPLIDQSRRLSTVQNFLAAHDLDFPAIVQRSGGATTVLWSDIRFCWRPAQPDEAVEPVLTAPGSQVRMSCALWFGGEFDGSGEVTKELLKVGNWLQTRAPGR